MINTTHRVSTMKPDITILDWKSVTEQLPPIGALLLVKFMDASYEACVPVPSEPDRDGKLPFDSLDCIVWSSMYGDAFDTPPDWWCDISEVKNNGETGT